MKRAAVALAAAALLAGCGDADAQTPRQQAHAMRDCLRAHGWTARAGERTVAARPPRTPHAWYRATFYPASLEASGPLVVRLGLSVADRRDVRGCRS